MKRVQVNAKNDLSDTQDALAEDSNFLIELKTTCAEQAKLYDQIKKMRSEEISAVGATIKILNDDDALDLFKKTLPSPGDSLLQVCAPPTRCEDRMTSNACSE